MSNLISAAITPAQKTNLLNGAQALIDNLPVTESISPKDKKAKQQLGTGGINYVDKAITFSEIHMQHMPRNFDLVEMKKDKALFTELIEIEAKVSDALNKIRMMLSMAGIDQMADANRVYKALQDAAATNSSMKPVVAEIGEFYKKRNSKDKTPPASLT